VAALGFERARRTLLAVSVFGSRALLRRIAVATARETFALFGRGYVERIPRLECCSFGTQTHPRLSAGDQHFAKSCALELARVLHVLGERAQLRAVLCTSVGLKLSTDALLLFTQLGARHA
jgi:hypothetical protein